MKLDEFQQKNFVICFFILSFVCKGTHAINGEFNLIRHLFANYNTEMRPVENDTDPVVVKFGIALNQIVDVQEKSEYITISVFLRQIWHDANLVWDPAGFNNVTSINVNPSKLWKPDIVLYNNVDSDKSFSGSLDQLVNRVIVSHTGEVKWLTPAILSAKCPMDVQYFPFDTQHCSLKFGSWTFDGFKMDMIALTETIDISSYREHSEWKLDHGELIRHVIKYGCCPEPFPDVTVEIAIKRRSLFYLMNLIFPMVVISMLTMLSFYLPSESGERIALAITLLLAMTVFMLIVGDIIPPTSNTVPLVAIFFSAVMVEMVSMIIILCYILKLHFKDGDDPMSPFMENIVLGKLSYTLGIQKKPTHNNRNRKVNVEQKNINNHQNNKSKQNGKTNNSSIERKIQQFIHFNTDENISDNNTTITYIQNGKIHTNGNLNDAFEQCFLSSSDSDRRQETDMMEMLNRKLDVFIKRIQDEDMENKMKRNWKICAVTIDRLSLIIFAFFFTATTLGCFLNAPGYVS